MKCERCGEVNPAEIHTCSPQEPLPAKSKGALSHEENKRHNKMILDKFYEENAHLYTAPPQEPVAWAWTVNSGAGYRTKGVGFDKTDIPFAKHTPLYTAPPQRQQRTYTLRKWQGLTDEEILEFEIWLDDEEEKHGWNPPADIVKYIEAKLKEKNSA